MKVEENFKNKVNVFLERWKKEIYLRNKKAIINRNYWKVDFLVIINMIVKKF